MNSSAPELEGYLTSKDAGALLGYTHDYISRLCRHGQMSGIQKGREWYVTRDELTAFKQRHEIVLQQKKKELSKKFSKIRTEAEAKKREARLNAQNFPQTESKTIDEVIFEMPKRKMIHLSLPKQLVAVAILGVLVLSPTIFDVISNTPVAYTGQTIAPQVPFSLPHVTETIGEGIRETIYAQSTVVAPTAAVFSFMPYLAEGYWQYFTTTGNMFRQSYDVWSEVGNIYLSLYVTQGELIYVSILDLHTLGASVIKAHELIGESFVYGASDILSKYKDFFASSSPIDSTVSAASHFTSDVSGGYAYVGESVSQNVAAPIANQVATSFEFFVQNVGKNISEVLKTISNLLHSFFIKLASFFEV